MVKSYNSPSDSSPLQSQITHAIIEQTSHKISLPQPHSMGFHTHTHTHTQQRSSPPTFSIILMILKKKVKNERWFYVVFLVEEG